MTAAPAVQGGRPRGVAQEDNQEEEEETLQRQQERLEKRPQWQEMEEERMPHHTHGYVV